MTVRTVYLYFISSHFYTGENEELFFITEYEYGCSHHCGKWKEIFRIGFLRGIHVEQRQTQRNFLATYNSTYHNNSKLTRKNFFLSSHFCFGHPDSSAKLTFF